MPSPVAVIALGNPLMGDEGIGIRILERLRERSDLPEGVDLIDMGTGGLGIVHELAGRERAVFIDCAFMEESSGTLRRFRPEEVRTRKVRIRYSLHEGDLLANLDLARSLGDCPEDIVIFGIEPATVEGVMELSPTLAAHLDEYVARVAAELKR
jgi:hydrogenase maturation protease